MGVNQLLPWLEDFGPLSTRDATCPYAAHTRGVGSVVPATAVPLVSLQLQIWALNATRCLGWSLVLNLRCADCLSLNAGLYWVSSLVSDGLIQFMS